MVKERRMLDDQDLALLREFFEDFLGFVNNYEPEDPRSKTGTSETESNGE